MSGVFTDDFRDRPWWWEASPPDATPAGPLPARADVVVVGSGYTGLHAALRLARAGRGVVVLEAGRPGAGCSTRNGGQVSTSIKPGLTELTRRHGADTARRILADGQASLDFTEAFIRDEAIDCSWRRCGRFHAAHSTRAFDALAKAAEETGEATVVPESRQRSEIGTDLYRGGVVHPRHAAVDPGRYHAGLLARAREAGAAIMPETPALSLGRTGGIEVQTPRGTMRAAEVVVATNGYTSALTPWLRRRVIPIGSYIIATEALPEALVDELIPRDRIVSDTRRVVYYYRASPDRRRILFGGRVSAGETDTAASGRRLHAEMVRLFPQLAATRVSHSWMGHVGYTFDTLAHAGEAEGVQYAMGYCGSGVGMAGYLGARTAARMLGQGEETGIERAAFPTRPLYRGRPWFLPAAVAYYRLRDRLEMRSGRAEHAAEPASPDPHPR